MIYLRIMTNTTQATAAGKVAAGAVKGSERAGAVLAKGTADAQRWLTAAPAGIQGYCPALYHSSLEARAQAFATDAGGCALIAEVEGRCARTRRPL